MTDGIIQKTIYEFVKSLGYENPKHQIMFMKLQQELIEKIKQEFNEENGFNVSYYNHATLLRLIGDNREHYDTEDSKPLEDFKRDNQE